MLASYPDIRLGEFDLAADNGVITLTGRMKKEEAIKEIIDIVSKIPGVKEVRSEAQINYRYQSIDT